MVRPRADNYEVRRQEILDAAAYMFAERGFDGTSISAIARRCGVSKALLYHYYPSKESLLYSMLHSHCELLVKTATAAIDDKERAESQLANLVSELMRLYMTSRDKHVVLMNSLRSLPESQQKEIKGLERQLVQIIKNILARLKPEMTESVRTSLAMYLMGAINWTYTWFKPKGPVSAEQFAELATSVYLNGICGELQKG